MNNGKLSLLATLEHLKGLLLISKALRILSLKEHLLAILNRVELSNYAVVTCRVMCNNIALTLNDKSHSHALHTTC